MSDSVTRSTLVLAAAWVLGRAWVVAMLHGPHAWVTGDLHYFAASLDAASDAGLGATLVEYPLPGVVVIALPWPLASWTGLPYVALAVWVAAVPLLGATAYARFDLAPGAGSWQPGRSLARCSSS